MENNTPGQDPNAGASQPAPLPLPVNPPPLISPNQQRQRPTKTRSGGGGWMVLAILAFIMLLGVLSLQFIDAPGMGTFSIGGSSYTDSLLEEATVKSSASPNKIAVIDLLGMISANAPGGDGMTAVQSVKRKLNKAANDDSVQAVILNVDSPGGEVLASDDIAMAIQKFQHNEHKPVIALMRGMAASGGYYVSVPSRWIVAHELTITGSIGVIMQGLNYRGLMDKVGVTPMVFKSGKYKDMLSGFRSPGEIPDEEKKLMQDLIDETYTRFTEVIKDGREYSAAENNRDGMEEDARALKDNWAEMADGRVFSGKTAWENGFVDELGDMDTAIERAMKLAGISEARVVRYHVPFNFGNIFRLLGKAAEPAKVEVDLGVKLPKLEAGRLYFLSNTLFQ
ncbi:MAG: signal peptide peptidase SppA [Verrucomicrobiales bacterium]|nr:signal peptide peptidase SppA [Verrucomicrobiales bacterium]|tara:strand:- start:16818 stop:18002 length:1185 start_codon:yes stop_codon:yes gene_type:complete